MKANTREFRNTLQTLLVAAVTCGMLSLNAGAAEAEDLAICDQVEDELLFDQAVSSVNIDVSCNEGIVTLDGTVDNILAKERAQRLTETVRGVLSIVNLIEVQPPQEKPDSEIQAEIETALLHNPATESYEVTATVQNGVATLEGTVDSWQEKQLSAHVAKGVAGVTEIDNQIGIEVGGTRTDSEIENDVEQSLSRDVFLDGAGLIDVSVEDGTVTRTGT
ncbi:MAG: BON domain-containing protein, partial [Planctomycetota bacterium]